MYPPARRVARHHLTLLMPECSSKRTEGRMIELTRSGDVHVVDLGDDANLIDPAFTARLHEVIDAVCRDSAGAAGLVLTARGKFFSNGLNVAEITKLDADGMRQFSRDIGRAFGRLLVLPVPSVAAVNGHAFAGGAALALACDYRVMRADRGWICLSEVDAGVPIAPGMMAMIRAKLSPATARDAVLAGKRFAADEAIAAGFVDAKAEQDALLARALEYVTPLAGKERGIFGSLKWTLWGDVARVLGVERAERPGKARSEDR
jgi:enoyl-CoA hydratase/carnithine racemase